MSLEQNLEKSMDPKSTEEVALVTVEEEKLDFWEEGGIVAKVGVDIGAIALIVEMVTVKEVLTVVELKMVRGPKEAAIAEARMVRDQKDLTTEEAKTVRGLKEVITVEVKTGKDRTEATSEEGAVVVDTVVVMIMTVFSAAEAVTKVGKEEGVGPRGKIKLTLTSELQLN